MLVDSILILNKCKALWFVKGVPGQELKLLLGPWLGKVCQPLASHTFSIKSEVPALKSSH